MDSNFPASNKPIILYRFVVSGHCHRVQLMLSLLEIPYEFIDLNRDGSNQPDWFLEISPLGQVPVIDDNGFKLSDSNAILVYLVKKYSPNSGWLPDDAVSSAKVQRWLSIAAGDLYYGPAIARFIKIFKTDIDYEAAYNKANALFKILNDTLNDNNFLTGDAITIADIAHYTYIAHAQKAG